MLSHSGLGTPEFSSASRSALVTSSGQWVQEAGSMLSALGHMVAPHLIWHTFWAHRAYALLLSNAGGPGCARPRVVGRWLRHFRPWVRGWDRAAPSRLVQPGPRDRLLIPWRGGYSRPAG